MDIIATIAEELTNLRYIGMDDPAAKDDMNSARLANPNGTSTADDIYTAIDENEFAALVEPNKQQVRDVVTLGGNIATNAASKARRILYDAFPEGTASRAALAVLFEQKISWAQSALMQPCKVGWVTAARAQQTSQDVRS